MKDLKYRQIAIVGDHDDLNESVAYMLAQITGLVPTTETVSGPCILLGLRSNRQKSAFRSRGGLMISVALDARHVGEQKAISIKSKSEVNLVLASTEAVATYNILAELHRDILVMDLSLEESEEEADQNSATEEASEHD